MEPADPGLLFEVEAPRAHKPDGETVSKSSMNGSHASVLHEYLLDRLACVDSSPQ